MKGLLNKRVNGFTLIELMLVVVIIGVLSMLSIPRFLESSRKAKYAQVKVLLGNIFKSMQDFYAEHGCYPPEVWANIPPPNLVPQYLYEWPNPTRDFFNSLYDYDVWDIGGGKSWVGVVYLGPNLLHDGGTGSGSFYVSHGKDGDIITHGDDMYLIIDPAGVPCSDLIEERITEGDIDGGSGSGAGGS